MEQYIQNIWNEFTDILNKAESISNICVKQTDERGRERLGSILYSFETSIEALTAKPETEFLAISMIRKYWGIVRPAIVIPAEEILEGNNSRIEQIKLFEKMLANNPAKEQWEEVSKQFKNAIEAGWYPMNLDKLNDLTAIIDIVSNALLSMDLLDRTSVYALNRGEKGKGDPIMLTDVAVFRNEYDATNAYMSLKQKRFVGFCGIQPLMCDTKDYFYEWKNGYPDERERNMVCSKMTKEEYLDRPDEYRRALYTVVRDGDNLYFFDAPMRDRRWEPTTSGFRTSYAPIQVFYKDPPMPTASTTSLIVPREHVWSLREILDDEQKVWLPLYFMQVCKHFFESKQIKSDDVVLPHTVAIAVREEKALVALNIPNELRATYVIPEPDEMFSDKFRELIVGCVHGDDERFCSAADLCRHFGITSTDLHNVPLTVNLMETTERFYKNFYKNVSVAYYTIIAKRLENVFEDEAREAHEWYHETVRNRWEEIKSKALLGKYTFASTRIHKRPVLNEDGSQKMEKRTTWSSDSDLVPVIQTTDISEGKEVRRIQPEYREYRVWSSPSLIGKHPPVVVALTPENADDIAEICGVKTDELPFFIRYANDIEKYNYFASRYNRIGHIQFNIRMIFGKKDYDVEIKHLKGKQNE